jgi:hypothetical protein
MQRWQDFFGWCGQPFACCAVPIEYIEDTQYARKHRNTACIEDTQYAVPIKNDSTQESIEYIEDNNHEEKKCAPPTQQNSVDPEAATVFFLDVDGVLLTVTQGDAIDEMTRASSQFLVTAGKHAYLGATEGLDLNPFVTSVAAMLVGSGKSPLRILQDLLKEIKNPKFVISSSWRSSPEKLIALKAAFAKVGILEEVYNVWKWTDQDCQKILNAEKNILREVQWDGTSCLFVGTDSDTSRRDSGKRTRAHAVTVHDAIGVLHSRGVPCVGLDDNFKIAKAQITFKHADRLVETDPFVGITTDVVTKVKEILKI